MISHVFQFLFVMAFLFGMKLTCLGLILLLIIKELLPLDDVFHDVFLLRAEYDHNHHRRGNCHVV